MLVEPAEEKEVKKGGIIIPDTAREKPTEGIVRAVGTGKRDDGDRTIPIEVKEGDRVLITKYGGTEVKLDGKDTNSCGAMTSSPSSNDFQHLKQELQIWQQNN